MLDGAPDEVLAGACRYGARVSSWLGSRLLASTVPILGGRIQGKVGDEVIETLTLDVPRYKAATAGGAEMDWRPNLADHPLATKGQALDVTIIVQSVITGETWETRRGRFQVKEWDDDDDGNVTVKGESLLARVRDDKLAVLSSPTGSFMSETRRLLPDGMGVSFGSGLVDRTVPGSMSWSKDRLKNFEEIAQAWPAVLRIDPWGQLRFDVPLPAIPVPILTVKDGGGGTLIVAPRSDTRDGVYNQVVASTGASDTSDVQGVAQVLAGPMNVNGPYGVVTKEFSSSLLETEAECIAAAQTILANSLRPAAAVPIRIAPDPRIQLDDTLRVLRGAEPEVWGWVTAFDLPLTPGDGDMRVDVGLP